MGSKRGGPKVWSPTNQPFARVSSGYKIPLRFAALEDLGKIDLTGISWVIVGGESGPGARPIGKEWVLSIREQCQAARVPFFFKQWGGKRKSLNGRNLDGRTYDEYPQRALIPVPEKAECLARAKAFASSMRKTLSFVQLLDAPA